MPKGNIFLLSWDCQGLESVINVTQHEKDLVWAELANKKPESRLSTVVNHLLWRARANSQRHYEIYTVTVDPGVTADDLRHMFDTDPQGSADLIRDRGNKIYSDRHIKDDQIKIV